MHHSTFYQYAIETSRSNLGKLSREMLSPKYKPEQGLWTYQLIFLYRPTARILILADGVDGIEPEQYVEFKNRVKNKGWEIIEFTGKHQQNLMLKHALLTKGIITTPLIMVCEHDWGFKEAYINWSAITKSLLQDYKLIQIRQDRLGLWELSKGYFGVLARYEGICLLPTSCFQGPVHVARCDWYRKVISHVSKPEMLEWQDMEHALVKTGGIREMACYIPSGPMGRLYHLDGRNISRLQQLEGMWNL